jgi:LAO/AO transport system kinase
MTNPTTGSLTAADQHLVDGVLAGRRRALAKTITLVESTHGDHQRRARQVLTTLLPHTGRTIRVGISGSPGAGKSTFIESLGLHLIDAGRRVAVLAVDPSSSVSGGSILGDKTRMELLCQRDQAFIRPSPSSGSLGGVADKTREAMLVCEAAGFDVIIVETVGVGQSEIAVAGMVDVFVLLQLPNAGDDLQAIKKGIVEIADLIVFNKADIDERAAAFARGQMRAALTMLRSASPNWRPPVLTVSALTRSGIAEFWTEIERYRSTLHRLRRIRRKAPPAGRGLDVESDRFRSAPPFPGTCSGALGTAGTVTRCRRRAHDAGGGSVTTADLSEALIAGTENLRLV